MTHFRIRYSKNETHVNARLFSKPRENTTFELHGHLCFRPVEWENFRKCMQGNAGKQNTVTVTSDKGS